MIEVAGQTDVGRRRKLNEDQFLVDEETQFVAVCDGMGGQNAGEVASQLAIETLGTFIQKSQREKEITWPYGLDTALSYDANRLKTAIMLANKRVFRTADNREEYAGMGTTVVAAIINNDRLTVGWAGDSRCYLHRDGQLQPLTRDDSWVAAAFAEGILTHADIERHPFRNVITKAVGAKDAIEVSVVEQPLQVGDLVCLCSDGLHGLIDDARIAAILAEARDLPASVRALIDAANEAGGKDNITVVLLRYRN